MSTEAPPPSMDDMFRGQWRERRPRADQMPAPVLAPLRAQLAEIVDKADPADLLAQAVADMEETGNDAA